MSEVTSGAPDSSRPAVGEFLDASFGYVPDVPLFSGMSIAFPAGKVTVLFGPNGSGKSTLGLLLLGLLRLTKGLCRLVLPSERAGAAAAVYQDVTASLLPWKSALANVAIPLELRGVPKGEARAAARSMLSRICPDVPPARLPGELSGGQRQLVSWARALVVEPAFLFLDEPFSSLDGRHVRRLVDEVLGRVQASGLSVLLITHDVDDVLAMADRIVLIGETDQPTPTILDVPLPHPRTSSTILLPEALAIRKRLLDCRWGQP
jgi:NitT/TauT family transport system ATP-binding protein